MPILVSEVRTSSPFWPSGSAALRVDDLGVEVVFPDGASLTRLDALLRHARADDFGKPVQVEGGQPEALFQLGAHALGPRLGAEDPDSQAALRRIEVLPRELVADHQQVGRR